MFVYMGHGAGDEFVRARALARQGAAGALAACILMGCSSGRLGPGKGAYDAHGPVLAYLLAGVQMHTCAHDNQARQHSLLQFRRDAMRQRWQLWLFCCCAGAAFFLAQWHRVTSVWCTGAPAAVANLWDVTDRDIDRFARALLGQWAAPLPEHSPLLEAASVSGQQVVSLSAAVGASRAACRLQHLIGAAPVCYGLPCSVAGAVQRTERT